MASVISTPMVARARSGHGGITDRQMLHNQSTSERSWLIGAGSRDLVSARRTNVIFLATRVRSTYNRVLCCTGFILSRWRYSRRPTHGENVQVAVREWN